MDLNKVMIIGRLTRDPEVRTTPSGQTVANFSVATGRQWTDKNSGEKKEQTEFHNIVAWRRLADIVSQYMKKGRQVYIEGHLQTRSWEDQTGSKRYRTEVVADNVIMLGNKGDAPVAMPAQPAAQAAPAAAPAYSMSAPPADDNTPPPPAPSDDDTISVEDIPF